VRARLVPRIRPTAGLSAVYLAATGQLASLARHIGAWPSVAVVTAGTAAAAELVNRTAT
jgi:hypothetical protein